MQNKRKNLATTRRGTTVLLDVISTIAEKNATSLCRGIMYEPEIPKKLRKKNQ
ncbi:MAG: cyclic lactone autoinducer peptide [Lachnospiraceae bacterium]|nr:cyclic lactone autoinducer peptide [Lachnospiraceae bacterium]